MKCHYTYDKNGEKFFIPMCYGSLYEDDKSCCTCSEPLTFNRFEKERYNKVIQSKNKTISDQQSELKHLRKVINNLIKQKP